MLKLKLQYFGTWCKELTHWKRPWCSDRLKAGGEGDDREWDGWMASPTWWIWVWVSSGSWWWTGKPGMLQSMGSQTVGHDWVTKLNWTFTFIRRLFSSFLLSAIRVVSSAYLRYWYFSWQPWFQLVLYPAWNFTRCTLHRSDNHGDSQPGWQYTASMYSFPNLEPVCCSMSSSNCCFLTCI